ncbi:hypothetical protein [Streptomyces sp. HD]|uniref:hypothetical protein n=1 Tax=Streptomyces sp. HD TaxID=3020892 RepID=UPI00232D475E|nr:hypothetical protein [Streptomyces sp. HD]MDC0770742.1 hypothetical protein [Streptomyces sp. HD]
MLSFSLAATFFVQTLHDVAGYGFTASVLSTSLVYMAPGSTVSMLLGPVSAHLVTRLGARTVLCLAGLTGCAGAVSLVVARDTTAEVITMIVHTIDGTPPDRPEGCTASTPFTGESLSTWTCVCLADVARPLIPRGTSDPFQAMSPPPPIHRRQHAAVPDGRTT